MGAKGTIQEQNLYVSRELAKRIRWPLRVFFSDHSEAVFTALPLELPLTINSSTRWAQAGSVESLLLYRAVLDHAIKRGPSVPLFPELYAECQAKKKRINETGCHLLPTNCPHLTLALILRPLLYIDSRL